MKPLLFLSVQVHRPIPGIFYCVRAFLLASLVCATPSRAQVLSDDNLLQQASSAYNQNDYLHAAMDLFAYIQRDPEAMRQDPDHAASVRQAIKYCEDRTRFAFTEAERAKAAKTASSSSGIGSSVSGLSSAPPALKKPKTQLQKSYTLVCRGGGNLYFDYSPRSNFSQRPQIWITVNRAQQAVGNNSENLQALKPGEAAWLDRPMDERDPTRLLIGEPVLRPNSFSISWQRGLVTGISTQLPYVNALQSTNNFQYFEVYNDRRGNLVVSAIGPKK